MKGPISADPELTPCQTTAERSNPSQLGGTNLLDPPADVINAAAIAKNNLDSDDRRAVDR